MKTFQYCAFLGLSFILCACNTASTQLTASNRAAQTTQNTPVEITLIATGGKPQELTYQVNPPTNGTLTGAAPSLTYIPATDFTGTDQFTFTVTKGTEVSNTATITISVTSLSLTAQNQSLQTIQNTPIDITLGVIGSGANQNLSYQVGTPSSGTLTGTAPNLTFTPALDFTGNASFSFSASNSSFPSNTATISITVTPLPLVAASQTLQTVQDTPLSITLSTSGGSQQTISYQVGTPANGTLTGVAPNLTYTPALSFFGTDDFSFSATDGNVTSNSALVSINITPSIFPITLQGATPEETSVAYFVTKPVGATNATITLSVFDPDFANEGELVINGNTPIPLFGAAGVAANNDITIDVVLNAPAAQWNDGLNTLIFRHLTTAGYIISAMTVSFQ